MYYVRFRPLNLNVALQQWRSGQNPLCGRYLNNRRTGKDTTNLTHSDSWDTVLYNVLNPYSLILKSSVGVYNFITNVYIINYKST